MAFSMAGLLKFLSDIGFLTLGNDEKEVAVEATPEFANIKFLFSAYPAPKRPTLFYKISSVHAINPLIKNIILEQSSYPNKLTTD